MQTAVNVYLLVETVQEHAELTCGDGVRVMVPTGGRMGHDWEGRNLLGGVRF